MKISMNDSRLTNINQLRAFLKGTQKFNLSLRSACISEKYEFIEKTVRQFGYKYLTRKGKKTLRSYLKKFTGYKHSQLSFLIKQATSGSLSRREYRRKRPHRIYTSYDIKLLEKTDELHLRLSEGATKEILRREHEIYKHANYQSIAQISHSHVTNLRHSPIYKSSWINHTKARQVPIGETRPPENMGKPGSIRVDVVHQKDMYYINSVDEITQWEVVVCVPAITEYYMIPALEKLIQQYPFTIFNFHSDRGGENINYQVADLLQRLLIKQTKTRSRHPNDNALVETKNGSVIRKNMGWEYITKKASDLINQYYENYFNPYLNFHRPCGFPTIKVNEKGKKKKVYKIYKTPYDALKAIPQAERFLKKKISFEKLDIISYERSDNEFAEILRKEERILFNKIHRLNQMHGTHKKT
ncbi:integrase [Patescibacteria group bacterium]|nr:integrase [Patescibacteria group bacterium]